MKIRKSSLNGSLVGRHNDILVIRERRDPSREVVLSADNSLFHQVVCEAISERHEVRQRLLSITDHLK